jgi:hypothetical protein
MSLPAERFQSLGARQLVAPYGSHKAHLFGVQLSLGEMDDLRERERQKRIFGVSADTEQTQVEVRTLGQILEQRLVDHSTVGMIMQTCLHNWMK